MGIIHIAGASVWGGGEQYVYDINAEMQRRGKDVYVLVDESNTVLCSRFAETAEERGIGCLIAGAGMAAHLAGVVASFTTLPVIGVPLEGGSMRGMDALLSTVQMPSGMPVATVAVNGAKNAALLAIQILAVGDAQLAGKYKAYRADMTAQVEAKNVNLQKQLNQA